MLSLRWVTCFFLGAYAQLYALSEQILLSIMDYYVDVNHSVCTCTCPLHQDRAAVMGVCTISS